jgi:hypothetical protein
MMKILAILVFAWLTFFTYKNDSVAQTTDRPRPAEWNNLVFGGRFMDRFLPMQSNGQSTRETWGADNVLPRYTGNGIENRKWSFWGGNIKQGEDGKYNLYVCGWLESSPKGHNEWPNSIVFHAVSEYSYGPFVVKDTIGKGHNPEIFKLKDDRYVLYVIDGYYLADDLNGPWRYSKFEFLNRDRKIIEGLSNLTFAQREDGSYLMVCRGGGVWISETGLSQWNQITEKRAYPPVDGRFEDPVVWRDNVQYNLIVNDWLGRIARYERSKDGLNWKVESGEAYLPGVSVHEDGTVEGWWKYERLKIFQDQYGRAIQGNFAVIDVEKKFDKANDIHSSKNIAIPLAVGRLLTILNHKQITSNTKTISVKIAAEPDFNPQTAIDLATLRFGDPEEVNYGRGCKALKTEKSGRNLVVTFDGTGNGLKDDEFAAKLLGKTTGGKLLFGYARLPGVDFVGPMLSPRLPDITPSETGFNLNVEVQNFGQTASKNANISIVYSLEGKDLTIAKGKVPKLKPFEKTTVGLTCGKIFRKGLEYKIAVLINPDAKQPSMLHGKVTPVK